jgi:hypothetical protein
MLDHEHKLPMNLCPACGYAADRATGITGKEKPEIGDYSVCINCGALLRFGVGFTLEHVKDVNDLLRTWNKRAIIKASQSFIRARGPIPKNETKH